MNSDSVEAKKPYMILDDAFTCGINLTAYDWPDYKDLKPDMLKALDKHYASKFIELWKSQNRNAAKNVLGHFIATHSLDWWRSAIDEAEKSNEKYQSLASILCRAEEVDKK